MLNTEGLKIAEEINDKEYVFRGNVLSAKLSFSLGKKEAPRHLEAMLQQTQDREEIATYHYELWKMTCKGDHRQTALNFYQSLYEATPNIEYKMWMEEMDHYRD